jgi:hypothetical protein
MSYHSRKYSLSVLFGLFLGIGYGVVWRIWASTSPANIDRLGRFEQAWAALFVLPWNLIICCFLIWVLRAELNRGKRAWPTATILGVFLTTLVPR